MKATVREAARSLAGKAWEAVQGENCQIGVLVADNPYVGVAAELWETSRGGAVLALKEIRLKVMNFYIASNIQTTIMLLV